MGQMNLNEPMSRHTSWKVGGCADKYFRPDDLADLSGFLRRVPSDEPVEMVGLGSNLLVRDGGIRGVVIAMHRALNEVALDGEEVYAEAGVSCAKVARFAAANGFAGSEFLAGIPGTIGGALAMNAGCYGSETWSIVKKVRVVSRDGSVRERAPSEYKIGYRSVQGPEKEWFAAAWFHLAKGAGGKERIREMLQKRISSQPLELPNAGSVFRNPEKDYAARLIESCGLKGMRIGGAEVSTKHANFIVNANKASARDIEELIDAVQRIVLEKTGVRLHREVRILGEELK